MNLLYIYAALIVLIIFKINPIQTYGQKFNTSNRVYYIETEQKYSWFEALIACIEMDMTLVTIDTAEKSFEINNIVRTNYGKVLLWIGGVMSRFPNRHFIWLDTGKRFSYTYWQGSNPDFYGSNEYCAHIGWGSNLEWNDIACTNHQGFICEYSEKKEQNKKLQQEVEKEKKNLQDLQHQLQLKNQKEKELQEKLREQKTLHNKLKQELETKSEESRRHEILQENLKEQVEEQKKRFDQKTKEIEKLQDELKESNEKQLKLQQDLLMQQNQKDMALEELKILKSNIHLSGSESSKKYRDIIFHIHHNK
ncbi:uncharacterized protein ACRADG_004078 [Cochliomyia hominivorax]